jgi:hypothetical protein
VILIAIGQAGTRTPGRWTIGGGATRGPPVMQRFLHAPFGSASNVACFPVQPRDPEIRSALRAQIQIVHADDAWTCVVDELPICQQRARADVAVINGELSGFEIKSDVDRLSRLTTQVDFYGRVFDRAAVVAGPKHLRLLRQRLPTWWGLWVAEPTHRNEVILHVDRLGETNDAPSRRSRVAMLARDEMVSILRTHGANDPVLRGRRLELETELLARLTDAQVSDAVRDALRARPRATRI